MKQLVGEKIKFWMQTEDGVTYELSGMVTQLSVGMTFDGPPQVEMTMLGLHPGIWSNSSEIAKRRNAPEWKCDFCGRPNVKDRETCASCGAVRSFVYGT